MIRRNLFAAISLALMASIASADVLHLKRGGRLEGVLISEEGASVTIDVGMGRVSLPRTSILRIERSTSALEEFRARLGRIPSGDVRAYVALARFASDAALRNEARIAWTRVAEIDPSNPEAHRGLGHVWLGGRYVDEEESYRERGYIRFEGRWMTRAEQEAVLREREDVRLNDRRLEEARRAARDAEDRARRAEAEAARARSEAARGDQHYGAPLIVGGPYWGGYGGGCYGASCTTAPPTYIPPAPPPGPTPIPRAAPVRPSSIR